MSLREEEGGREREGGGGGREGERKRTNSMREMESESAFMAVVVSRARESRSSSFLWRNYLARVDCRRFPGNIVRVTNQNVGNL